MERPDSRLSTVPQPDIAWHLCYSAPQLNRADESNLIQRGRGTGPVKPRQPGVPSCARYGANSVRPPAGTGR